MKRLIVRADASTQIGAGHIMRCLALAQAWQDNGGRVVFLSHCENEAWRRRITAEGCDLIHMENSHPHPEDLRRTLECLECAALDTMPGASGWVVVDGYHFGATYQEALKQAGARLLCLDDYGHAAHYSADLVLNQNISANEELYRNREFYTRLLLGPRYALLRREFRLWRGWSRTIPEVARKVLVTMGGTDPANVTLKVVEALKAIGDPQLEVRIVVGSGNPNLEVLESALLSAPCPMRLLKDVTDMPALMAWADLAVSAGGSTCWELAFMGLPPITITFADNQQPVADMLNKRGMVINLGGHESVTPGQLAETLASALHSRDKRMMMSAAGQALVDGEGADRVCKLMKDSRIRLRPVCPEDCQQLWEWANDPEVRAVSFSSAPIPWETHQQWFCNKLDNGGCYIWMAIDSEDRVFGQIRFEVCGPKEAETHVSIDKKLRRAGYGSLLIDLGARTMFSRTVVRFLNAYIRCDNVASIRAFERAGFVRQGRKTILGIESYHYVREKQDK